MAIYPDAIWRPGPPSKQGYASYPKNFAQGVVLHSMVGYFGGAMAELDKLERRASWHFSINRDGKVYQHYDTEAVTWHCGSAYWNGRLIGIEHEGGFNPANEPLTPAQLASSQKLVQWLAQTHGFTPVRGTGIEGRTLFEHNEIAPPSDPTSCPSKRIPWDAYTGGRMYTDKQIDEKVGAVLGLGIEHGRQIHALATAFFDHIRNHNGTAVAGSTAEFQALVEKFQAELDALDARIRAAAAALAPEDDD